MKGLICELLGYSVPYAHIHYITMTLSPQIIEKSLGYICAQTFLKETDESLVLVVNSILRNLKSRNTLDNNFALICLSYLLNDETIPIVLDELKSKFEHSTDLIRKKTIVALHRCIQKNPDVWDSIKDLIEKGFRDQSLSIVYVSLLCYLEIMNVKPDVGLTALKPLIPEIVSLSSRLQTQDIRVDKHDIEDSTWIQIRLLKLMSSLCKEDPEISDKLRPSLIEIVRVCDVKGNFHNIGVLLEVVQSFNTITPNESLLIVMKERTMVLIESNHLDAQYIGLKIVIQLLKYDKNLFNQYSREFLALLKTGDEMIQDKAFNIIKLMEHSDMEKIVSSLLDIWESAYPSIQSRQRLEATLGMMYKFNQTQYTFILEKMFYILRITSTDKYSYPFVRTWGLHILQTMKVEQTTAHQIAVLCEDYLRSGKLTQNMNWWLGLLLSKILEPMENKQYTLNILLDLLERCQTRDRNSVYIVYGLLCMSGKMGSMNSEVRTTLEQFAAATPYLEIKSYISLGLGIFDKSLETGKGEAMKHLFDETLDEITWNISEEHPLSDYSNLLDDFMTPVTISSSSTDVLRYLPYQSLHENEQQSQNLLKFEEEPQVEPEKVKDGPWTLDGYKQ